jgi:ligand-binding sensor domain-containing protein
LNRFDGYQFVVYRYDPYDSTSLSDNFITALLEDRRGRIWVGTQQGLNLFDRGAGIFSRIMPDSTYPNSLSHPFINDIAEDRQGNIVVATWGGGLNILTLPEDDKGSRDIAFKHIRHVSEDHNSLSNNLIRQVVVDDRGVIWISTSVIQKSALHKIIFDKFSKDYRVDRAGSKDFGPEGGKLLESGEEVIRICKGRNGNLWIGVGPGLIRWNTASGKPAYYNLLEHRLFPPGEDWGWVFGLLEDSSGNIWMGTYGGWVLFDPLSGQSFDYQHKVNGLDGLHKYGVSALCEDRGGIIWLGSIEGLLKFDPRVKSFRRYRNDPGNLSSLSHNVVRAIHEDPRQPDRFLWVGTAGGGLNRFDMVNEVFVHFTQKDGLPDNVIYAILSDNDQNLWMSTNHGLSRFNPKTLEFKNFDIKDGLQDNEFNAGAYFKSESGELFFGGIKGFNAFYPEDIRDNRHRPPVIITDFQIFNESVSFKEADSPLKTAISETKEITLSYEDKVFSFEFAALDYTEPTKNRYMYIMENFDKDWRYAGTNRMATYTNLDPGKYRLRVRGSNNDSFWNEEGTSVTITITPPWWRTGWAYTIFALLIVTLLYILRRYELNRQRLKYNP